METDNSFIDNVNSLASLDKSYGSVVELSKSNFTMVDTVPYSIGIEFEVYNLDTTRIEKFAYSQAGVVFTTLSDAVVAMCAQLALDVPYVIVDRTVAYGTTAIRSQSVYIKVTSTDASMWVKSLKMTSQPEGGLVSEINGTVLDPRTLLPKIAMITELDIVMMEQVLDAKDMLQVVAAEVVPNIDTILNANADMDAAIAAIAIMNDGLDEANAIIAAVQTMTVDYTELQPTDISYATYDGITNALQLGIQKGADGLDGTNGLDGYTPVKGIDYFDGENGIDGQQGLQGDQGVPGIQGDKGDRGDQGISVVLQGTKATIADLPVVPLDPNDYAGHAWMVTTGDGGAYLDGALWFWDIANVEWDYIGKIVGPQGDTGATGTAGLNGTNGRGIASINRTFGDGASGTTDIYTIVYSDATASTFNVYNGEDGTTIIDDTVPLVDKTYSSSKTQAMHDVQAQAIANISGASASFYSTSSQLIPENTDPMLDLQWTNLQMSSNSAIFELGVNEIVFKKDGNYNFLNTLTFFRVGSGAMMTVTFEMYDATTNLLITSYMQNIDMLAGTKETVPMNAVLTISGASAAEPVVMKVRMKATTATGTLELFAFNSILAAQSVINLNDDIGTLTEFVTALG